MGFHVTFVFMTATFPAFHLRTRWKDEERIDEGRAAATSQACPTVRAGASKIRGACLSTLVVPAAPENGWRQNVACERTSFRGRLSLGDRLDPPIISFCGAGRPLFPCCSKASTRFLVFI